MKQVLVLGSEGYLGSVLVPHLNKLNYKIVGVDICLFEKNNKNSKNVKIIKKDYSKLKRNFFKKFDYIIDLINISNDPASEIDQNFTKKINYHDKTLMHKKIQNLKNIKLYIYMSSCSVYGFNKKIINEKTLPRPISLYSKLCLKYEKYLKKHSMIDYTILRLGTLYGWSKRMRYDIAINKIIRDMVFNKKVEVLGGGQLRFFCYNKFACKIIEKVLKEKVKFINKVLNIGIFNTNIINLTKKIINITKLKNINLVHEKYNIDNRSYEVSLTSVKKIFKNFNFEKYVKNSIIDTFKAIKKDRSPFNRKKVTLNIYKDYLNK
jgi:nucleoside-diphosphate-sugar epimerase